MKLRKIEDINLSQEALREIIIKHKQEIKDKAIKIEKLKKERIKIFENTNLSDNIHLISHIKKTIYTTRREIRVIIHKIDAIEKIKNREKKGA